MSGIRCIITCTLVISAMQGGLVLAHSTRKLTDPSEIPSLVSDIRDGDEETRIDAAYKLGHIWPITAAGEASSALIRALHDPSEQVRIHAAAALGELKARKAIDPLILATGDPSGEVPKFAAQSLGQIGLYSRRAVPSLWRLLESHDYGVRTTAAIALGMIR